MQDLYFANFYFRTNHKFLNLRANTRLNLKIGVFNISGNFEFARQRILRIFAKIKFSRIHPNLQYLNLNSSFANIVAQSLHRMNHVLNSLQQDGCVVFDARLHIGFK